MTALSNGRNWSLEQQTAIFNAVARLDNIRTVCFNWTPLLEQSLYLDLLEMPSLRSLELKITDPTVFTLLMERMKEILILNDLFSRFEWMALCISQNSSRKWVKCSQKTKFFALCTCMIVAVWTNQSLAMHPMIQKNTTLTISLYLILAFTPSPLWSNCKSICDGD